jgi:hypothetical protein
MVEEVKEVASEFNLRAFSHRDVLDDREIKV